MCLVLLVMERMEGLTPSKLTSVSWRQEVQKHLTPVSLLDLTRELEPALNSEMELILGRSVVRAPGPHPAHSRHVHSRYREVPSYCMCLYIFWVIKCYEYNNKTEKEVCSGQLSQG